MLSYIKSMGDAKENFFVAAEIEFAWLVTEFGFKEVNRTTGETFASIAWATKKTFVEVVLELPRPYIDVQFGALVGGSLPSASDGSNRHHLSALVLVRAHDQKRAMKLGDIPGPSKNSIRRGLRDCARTLKELATDVLIGDHTIFKELAAYGEWRMSQYRAKYPG
jgi:hypothetical protein